MTATPATTAVEAVWRIEAGRLIAALTRLMGDLGAAEDLAQDALVAALSQWPVEGVPDNPGAWLMAVARRRGIDTIRRRVNLEQKVDQIGRALPTERVDDPVTETRVEGLREGLHRLDWVEGRNLALDFRFGAAAWEPFYIRFAALTAASGGIRSIEARRHHRPAVRDIASHSRSRCPGSDFPAERRHSADHPA